MKNQDKNCNMNCDEIERLLIKKNIDELTPDENLSVEVHLKSCERCRAYRNALLNLQNSVQIKAKDKLAPDPAIRQNIIQRMRTQKLKETGILKSGWKLIRNILEYRIPVYQALFSVFLVLSISLALKHLSFPVDQKPSRLEGFAQADKAIITQMNVIENLELIDHQRIGRNAKEDSTLTRFIVTTR